MEQPLDLNLDLFYLYINSSFYMNFKGRWICKCFLIIKGNRGLSTRWYVDKYTDLTEVIDWYEFF